MLYQLSYSRIFGWEKQKLTHPTLLLSEVNLED